MMIVEVENIARLSPVCVLSSLEDWKKWLLQLYFCIWKIARLSPVSWVHCLAPGAVMSIVWERGNDPRQMENNNVSPLSCLAAGAPVTTGGYNDFVKSTQRRAVTWIYLRGNSTSSGLLSVAMIVAMIVWSRAQWVRIFWLYWSCNFIGLEYLLNIAISTIDWTQTRLVW